MTQKLTLHKQERLKSRKLIDRLFNGGQSLFQHPCKLVYLKDPHIQYEDIEASTNALLFSVTIPKKKLRSATHRNLLKRRIREAYRQHKQPLQEKLAQENVTVCLMFIYIEREIQDYAVIEKGIIKLLKKLDAKLFPKT
jgi:ribonuclease P protein component